MKAGDGRAATFNRGVSVYPTLGDRVRVASRPELEQAFCGDKRNSVRVGCIRQDPSIAATIRVDDLLGKHFAILGTTGTGKSCTTALILRSILQKNPAAHIVLLDPHNEYAPAFGDWAEVISQRNMQLPYWLLTFEELVEVLIGDPLERKAEVEILQELIPLAKARYGTGRGNAREVGPAPLASDAKYTVDTPVPYRISDLTQTIDDRMGKLENKRDLSPYRNLKTRLEIICLDPRYAFMFGSVTVYDSMAQILGRIFRVPVNDKPITILELTGLPTEIINVVVSVLCRMTFDFALWSEGKVPVTLVCEEAHRYVPSKPNLGFEPCKRAIAKIAKEGRKYGASLCIVTQRPAEIDPTILSQCNTVFALRMSNDRDQEIVKSAISDTGSGLLEFLTALGQREAIAFGDGVTLPVRIKFDELPKHCMPRSSTARFTEKWQKSVGDEGFLESIVDRWRNSSCASAADAAQHMAMFAESMNLTGPNPDARRTCRRRRGIARRAGTPGARVHPARAAARPACVRHARRPARQRAAHHPRSPAAALIGPPRRGPAGFLEPRRKRCYCCSLQGEARCAHERHLSGHSVGRLGHPPVAAVAGDVPQAVHPLLRRPAARASSLPRCSGCRGRPASPRPSIVCNNDHRFLVKEEAERAGVTPRAIVLEPVARNTAPAAAVAALRVARDDPAGILVVMPSDHVIKDEPGFVAAVRQAAEVAETGKLVLLGIAPDRPHTGYGYIRRGLPAAWFPACACRRGLHGEAGRRRWLPAMSSAGTYSWNSGIFIFRARRLSRRAGAPRARRPGAGKAGPRRGQGGLGLPAPRGASLCPGPRHLHRLCGHGADRRRRRAAGRHRLERRRLLVVAVGDRPARCGRQRRARRGDPRGHPQLLRPFRDGRGRRPRRRGPRHRRHARCAAGGRPRAGPRTCPPSSPASSRPTARSTPSTCAATGPGATSTCSAPARASR